MSEKNLSTAEKFLLIAHHPEKGGFIISQTYIQYGLPGAILLDMMLEGRIEMIDKKLILKTGSSSPDPVINEVSSQIARSPEPRKADHWVRKLSIRYNNYKWQILNSLADKMIVRIEHRRFLGIIPFRVSYLIESHTRSNIIRQVRNEILSYRGLSDNISALAGMIEACRMYRILSSDRDEQKQIRSNLKKIIKDIPLSDATGQTIRQVQAAIMASVAAAVIASAAGRH